MLRRVLAAVFTLALVAPAAAQADTSGLVAAYGFEEGSGTVAADSSPAGNGGTLSGPTRSTAGRYGGALSFDGSNDMVTVADSSSLDLATGMTLEAWVRPSVTSGEWRTVVIKEQPAALVYALYSGEGNARPSVHAFTSREYDTRGSSTLALNTWSHLAATYDGATLRVYVNGAQVSSRALTGAMRVSSGALRIGGNAIWGEYFKGLIDEVRIYNRALTAAEIGADMAAPIAPGDASPPTAPAGLTASVAADDVTLEWTASTDDVGVTGYRVHRATTLDFTPTAANRIATVTGTTYTDADRPFDTWVYKVVAVDAAGNASAPSDQAIAVVEPAVPPAPTDLQATVDQNDVHLSWTAQGAGISANRVYRSTDPGFTPGEATLIDTVSGDWTNVIDSDRPAGTYYYKVIAVDAHGTPSAPSNEASATVSADQTPPTLAMSVTCPLTVSRTTTFFGTRADDSGDAPRVELLLDGEHLLWAGGAGISGFIAEWDTYQTPNGTYTLTAVARDAAGNETATEPCEVTVDNVPLSIEFTAPADGAAVDGIVPLTAETRFDGVLDGDFISYRIDGVRVATLPAPDGTATYDWDTAGLADGSTHELTAEMRDPYLTEPPYRTTTIHVTIDRRPAAPVVTGSVDSDGQVRLSAPFDDDVASYRVHRSATAAFEPDDSNLIKTTSALWAFFDAPGTGTWHYHVVAVDDAGKRSLPSDEVTLTVPPDTQPPIVYAHVGGECDTTVGGIVDAVASANDERSIVYLQLELDGEALGDPAGNRFVSVELDTRQLSAGPHVLTATARDGDGNEATSAPCTFTVDNSPTSPPTVSISAPDDGATVGATTTVRAVAADNVGVASVQFEIDGEPLGPPDTTSAYSTSWNTLTAANGPHVLTAIATDTDGNATTSAPVSVTVQNEIVGLAAAYGFEEASGGAVTDSSGNGNGGTIEGATRAAAGRYGAALSFDGAGDLVTVPDAPELDLSTAGSVEAWVKPVALSSSWRTIAMKGRPGGLAYALYAAADAPRPSVNVWAGGSETDASGPAQLPLNAWSHVAMTYDSIALKLYVDGTAVATQPLTAPILTSSGALTLGGNTVWPEWFNGLIDEVRVYERALTAAEVEADRGRPVVL